MRWIIRIHTPIRISHVKNHQLGHQEHIPKNNVPSLTRTYVIYASLAHTVIFASGIANEIFAWDDSVVRLRIDAARAARLDKTGYGSGRSEGNGEIGQGSSSGIAWDCVDPFRLLLCFGNCGEVFVNSRGR